MFQFKPDKKVYAIRHVIRPSASVSYSPNFGVDPDKYYKTYLDRNGVEQHYSIFEGKLYGTPTGSERSKQSGTLNLSIDNNVEMKVRNDKDTTGKEDFKKVKLLESFPTLLQLQFLCRLHAVESHPSVGTYQGIQQ